MADLTHCVKHIESFVDSSCTPAQQAASVDAIAALVKNDIIKLESLVREMGLYLTTTDSFLRARGTLLLAELLACLASKPLENETVLSLIGFFTERLVDWKALHGALIGCLSLLRRKGNVGIVSSSKAQAVTQSFLQNVQVQSLRQSDRKLCFELLRCLLERYPDDVVHLENVLIPGICESIDGEKDPECLMLAFQIVEVLVHLYPDPTGPLSSYASDLFENLSCYFPIHFTHPKGEDIDVKKEELSRTLMVAFASTPLFEPFAIPLLLEKLSSSLPLAKVESLKYLSYCSDKYGAARMAKHVKVMWSALKDIIYTSPESVLSLESELVDGMSFQESHTVTEALLLLQKVIYQNSNLLLDLIVSDEDIKRTVDDIHQFKDFNGITLQSKQRLHAVGCILYLSAKASIASCNRVFEGFFPCLIHALGISLGNSDAPLSSPCNIGATYLCVELLAGCRTLVIGTEGSTSTNIFSKEAWCNMLCSYGTSLIEIFGLTLVTGQDGSTQNAYLHYGVKGLQILATFPGNFHPLSKSVYESILLKLMSVVTLNFKDALLWKLALKALVEIGSFVDKSEDTEKARSFDAIVVDRIASLMLCDDLTMPSQLKLEIISSIGTTGLSCMQKILQGLESSLSASLSGVFVNGDPKLLGIAIALLECYSCKVLPWFDSIGGHEEVQFHFALNIWDQIENNMSFCVSSQEQLLDAAMTAMQYAVGRCLVQSQTVIVNRAFSLLSSITSIPLKDLMNDTAPVNGEGFESNDDLSCFSCRDNWIISLFASVVKALRPQAHITNVKVILQLFLTTQLYGHVASAQALGSIINKLAVKVDDMDASKVFSLEEAMDMIFSSRLWILCNEGPTEFLVAGNNDDTSFRYNSLLVKSHAIEGLAWIGKGLLMRGHEKVKDIVVTLLSCLLPNYEQGLQSIMRTAADAFYILISDSDACLNKRLHATIRPLYKQRLFSIVLPVILSLISKADSSIQRAMLYRAFANVVCGTPLSAILSEAKKLIPILVDSLFVLSEDILHKDIVYSILLVLSGILTDKKRSEVVVENAHIIIRRLIALLSYPHMMVIRETAIQCLTAMSELPHARIYPMRTQVLLSISKTLDDPKRAVRQEAVKCRQAWASMA
ncbi:MMS19 nucleotide excision repair protein homolog isoform X2 [Apium graveolens]|uniref:MMS19 nucleotide excision repair protein homolog isoform X2 n=1 Tax=Apium graveolens TaxID=4045 RepID=UPI003D7AEA55